MQGSFSSVPIKNPWLFVPTSQLVCLCHACYYCT